MPACQFTSLINLSFFFDSSLLPQLELGTTVFKGLTSLCAGLAQLVEQLICNQQVAGSSPIASFLLRSASLEQNQAILLSLQDSVVIGFGLQKGSIVTGSAISKKWVNGRFAQISLAFETRLLERTKVDGFGRSTHRGEIPKWPTGADCKSAGYAFAGSNPALSTTSFENLEGRGRSDRTQGFAVSRFRVGRE